MLWINTNQVHIKCNALLSQMKHTQENHHTLYHLQYTLTPQIINIIQSLFGCCVQTSIYDLNEK